MFVITSFEDVLNTFVEASHMTKTRIAKTANLHIRTLENWLGGRVKKPRDWRDVVRLAKVMELDEAKANELLRSAAHPTIATLIVRCQRKSEVDNLELLSFWRNPAPPMLLPRRPPIFMGRASELNWLQAHLRQGHILAVCASGGMGKTTVVSELIWRLKHTHLLETMFPDGVFFYSFYGLPYTHIALDTVARTFGADPTYTTITIAARSALANKQALLIWDGVEEADNLQRVLDVGESCTILLTSRRRSDAPDPYARLDLGGLADEDALDLLRKTSKSPNFDEAIARECIALVGNLPLAIHLIGRYIDSYQQSPTDFILWLRRSPLEALDFGKRRRESVPILLKKSVAQLSLPEQEMLVLMGSLALHPISADLLQCAFPSQAPPVTRALGGLINWGLVTRINYLYILQHPLIHTYTATLSATHSLLERLATHLAKMFVDTTSIHEAHLSTFAESLNRHRCWQALLAFARHIQAPLHNRGYTQVQEVVLTQGITAAKALADTHSEMRLRETLGIAFRGSGESVSAITQHEKALKLAEQFTIIEQTRIRGELSADYEWVGDFSKARILYQQSLMEVQDIGEKRLEATYLRALAALDFHTAQYETALERVELALAILQNYPNKKLEPALYSLQGRIYQHMGERLKAIVSVQTAVSITRVTGDQHTLMRALSTLGYMLLDTGRLEENLRYQQEALKLARDLNSMQGELYAAANIGHIHMYQRRPEMALEYYNLSYSLSLEQEDWNGKISQASNLGWVHSELNDGEQTLHYAKLMYSFAEKASSTLHCARAMYYIARAHRIMGDVEKALRIQMAALEVTELRQDRRTIGHHLDHVGELHHLLGNLSEAHRWYEEALIAMTAVIDKLMELPCRMRLAILCQEIGDTDAAREHFMKSRNLAKELSDDEKVAECEIALATIL